MENYPIIKINKLVDDEIEEEEIIEEEEEVIEQEDETKMFNFKTPKPKPIKKKKEVDPELKQKRIENLKKAREARQKKNMNNKIEVKSEVKSNPFNYDLIIDSVVNRLEENRTIRKKNKIKVVEPEPEPEPQPKIEEEDNIYDSLFRRN